MTKNAQNESKPVEKIQMETNDSEEGKFKIVNDKKNLKRETRSGRKNKETDIKHLPFYTQS